MNSPYIQQLLGNDAAEFEYTLDDDLRLFGWMKHLETEQAIHLARSELTRMNDLNIRFFAGASPLVEPPSRSNLTLFALPGLPAPRIADFCRVGPGFRQSPWIRVRRALERIEQLASFSVFFATQVTIEMKFAHPVDEHTAAELEAVALEVSPELDQVYDGEMLPKSIRKAIRETGELKLWWD